MYSHLTVLCLHGLCRLFSRNLAYYTLIHKFGGHSDSSPTPLNNDLHTPAYLTVSNPQHQRADSRRQEGMPSPTHIMHKNGLIDRAQLLLNGRDMDLMNHMSGDERRCAISGSLQTSSSMHYRFCLVQSNCQLASRLLDVLFRHCEILGKGTKGLDFATNQFQDTGWSHR